MSFQRFAALSIVALCGTGSTLTPPAGTPAAIERVASLRTARSVHTTTTLASGHVLVAGGMADGGGSLGTVEVFDPATNSVQALSPMSRARSGHTATLLAEGRVLVVGGYNGAYESSVEIFDPATRRFTAAGSLLAGRSGHTATMLSNGRVLIVGGVGTGWSFLSSAELFDPLTGRSEAVGAMTTPRESHTATLLADGSVLVTGGHNGRREAMVVHASAERFDPVSRRFEPAGTLGIPRHKHDAVQLHDGRVLIIGGADRTDRRYFASTEVYDPRAKAFSPGPTMANSRYKIVGTSARLPNGDVLITSGAQTAELLDARSMTYREVSGRFPDAYHFATTAVLANGDVVITGGYAGFASATDGVWRFRQ